MALFKRKKRKTTVDVAEPVMTVSDHVPAPSGSRPSFNDITVGDMSSGVPRIRVGEMFGSFKRQLKWFIPLLILGTLAAWFLTADFKRTYHADGSFLVQLGGEYVYDPIGTEASPSAGLTLTPDHIVLNEIAIMKNSDTIEALIGEMGPVLAPKLFEERGSNASVKYAEINAQINQLVDRSWGVSAKPKSSILAVTFKHEDPDVAVQALQAIEVLYFDARKRLFVDGSTEGITERRVATEEQLKDNEREIVRFLSRNNVSDFESEREGVTERTETLRETLNTLRADLIENERALASVEDQLRNTPQQIDLQVDDRASQRVAQAELELSQLLVKYLPESEPVRRKQAEVDELNRLQSSFGGNARGGRRVGPNEVYQELLTRRNTLQSTADALRERESLVQRQLDTADDKVRKLQNLSPTYAALLREQDTLDERLKDYNKREQEAIINQKQVQLEGENVKTISLATTARKGRNMRMLMFALATLAWGLTLGLIALMRVFLDPALYVGQPAVRGRRQVDRAAAKSADYAAPAVAASVADKQAVAYKEEPVPVPVVPPAAVKPSKQENTGGAPESWQPDPHETPYAGQGEAQAAYDAPYYEQAYSNQSPAAQPAYEPPYAQAYDGNAAQDLQYNPYAQAASGFGGSASTQSYLGVLPSSPEG